VLQEEKETRQISGVGFVLAVYATSRIFYLIAGFLRVFAIEHGSGSSAVGEVA